MEPQDYRRFMLAAVAAAVATFVTAFVTAIILAIVDLYLAGHRLPSLTGSLIDRAGLALSAGDIILLLLSLGAGIGAGTVIWRRGR